VAGPSSKRRARYRPDHRRQRLPRNPSRISCNRIRVCVTDQISIDPAAPGTDPRPNPHRRNAGKRKTNETNPSDALAVARPPVVGANGSLITKRALRSGYASDVRPRGTNGDRPSSAYFVTTHRLAQGLPLPQLRTRRQAQRRQGAGASATNHRGIAAPSPYTSDRPGLFRIR
jgi:hypothetical protein